MRDAQLTCFANGTDPSVRRAMAAIAEHARERQQAHGPGGDEDRLLSWERIAEFDAFKITVRCDYNLERI